MHQVSAVFPQRVTIAASIFVLCCLASSVRIVREAPSPTHRHTDDTVKRSEQRFAALKAALPQQGVLGYIGSSSRLDDYYLAQYALAPLVIENSLNHRLVVGNFATSPVTPRDDLQLVKDFGNRVLLFARQQSPSKDTK
jgi:hypothetical protein